MVEVDENLMTNGVVIFPSLGYQIKTEMKVLSKKLIEHSCSGSKKTAQQSSFV